MIKKIEKYVKDRLWLNVIWHCVKYTLYILGILHLTACERTYKPNKNYVYTFSGMIHVNDYGMKEWGAHHFVLDEPIKDMESFKECYVNYLNWSGLDKDGLYKKVYYQDNKNIEIKLFDERWGGTTLTDADLCNVD